MWEMCRLDVDAFIYVTRLKDSVTARRLCLEAIAEDLSVSAVDRLVLDLAEGHVAADKRTLFEATRRLGSKMRYEHRRSKTEPMLWVPDAVAWCYSHRGDWWNIAKPIVRRVRDL
jgi:hypothetical protein